MTKKEYAARYLYGKIQSGDYKKGQKLPSENALSIKLGISRLTAREAFKVLEFNGIIHSLHGKGYFVSDVINELSFGSLKDKCNVDRSEIDILPNLKIEDFFGIESYYKDNKYIAYSKKYFAEDKLKIATISFVNKEEIWKFNEEEVKESFLNYLISIGIMPVKFKETLVFSSHKLLDKFAKEMGYDDKYPIFVTRLKNEYNTNLEYALRIYHPDNLRITNTYKII